MLDGVGIFLSDKEIFCGTSCSRARNLRKMRPYDPQKESFDAVVISNALHIMPHLERVLAEIHRVLKPERLLFVPTFIHSKGTVFHPAA